MMEKYINEWGKECYQGVLLDDNFSPGLFHLPEWQPKEHGEISLAIHTNLGTLTVVVRRTGYIGSSLDTESGFRDIADAFWLASGNQDLRKSSAKTFREAIEWVKERANTCIDQ